MYRSTYTRAGQLYEFHDSHFMKRFRKNEITFSYLMTSSVYPNKEGQLPLQISFLQEIFLTPFTAGLFCVWATVCYCLQANLGSRYSDVWEPRCGHPWSLLHQKCTRSYSENYVTLKYVHTRGRGGVRDISWLQNIQSNSAAYTDSCSMATGFRFRGQSSQDVKLSTHLYLASRLRMSGAIRTFLLAHMPSWRGQGKTLVFKVCGIGK